MMGFKTSHVWKAWNMGGLHAVLLGATWWGYKKTHPKKTWNPKKKTTNIHSAWGMESLVNRWCNSLKITPLKHRRRLFFIIIFLSQRCQGVIGQEEKWRPGSGSRKKWFQFEGCLYIIGRFQNDRITVNQLKVAWETEMNTHKTR